MVAAVRVLLTGAVSTFNADGFTSLVMLATLKARDSTNFRVADHVHGSDDGGNSAVVPLVSMMLMEVVLALVVVLIA